MITSEFVAESLALLSGLELVRPALRLNRNLRKAADQQQRVATGRSRWVNEFRRGIAHAYTNPHWSLIDEALTIAGVVLLILSSSIKLTTLWFKPHEHCGKPPPHKELSSLGAAPELDLDSDDKLVGPQNSGAAARATSTAITA